MLLIHLCVQYYLIFSLPDMSEYILFFECALAWVRLPFVFDTLDFSASFAIKGIISM